MNLRWARPCDLPAALHQDRPVGAHRHRDQAVIGPDRLILVSVDDEEVRRERQRPARRRRVEAEEASLAGGGSDDLVGDLRREPREEKRRRPVERELSQGDNDKG